MNKEAKPYLQMWMCGYACPSECGYVADNLDGKVWGAKAVDHARQMHPGEGLDGVSWIFLAVEYKDE
jgi:hypothetical protein